MKDSIEQLLKLASDNVRSKKGGPFAAAVAREGVILAWGTDLSQYLLDPTAHAEISVIRVACEVVRSPKLPGAELWTIFDPCFMCLAALDEVGIATVRFILPLEFAADRGWIDLSLARPPKLVHVPSVRRVEIGDSSVRDIAIQHLRAVPLGDKHPGVPNRLM